MFTCKSIMTRIICASLLPLAIFGSLVAAEPPNASVPHNVSISAQPRDILDVESKPYQDRPVRYSLGNQSVLVGNWSTGAAKNASSQQAIDWYYINKFFNHKVRCYDMHGSTTPKTDLFLL
jgi:Pectate lyase superfamily protein